MTNPRPTKSIKSDPTEANAFSGKILFRMMQMILMAFALCLFTGCVSFYTTKTVQQAPLPAGEVKADQARVCVYCIDTLGGIPARISDGDTVIGELANRGYLCWDRPPGKAVLRAIRPHGRGIFGAAKAELPIEPSAGQTNYFQAGIDAGGALQVISPIISQATTTFTLIPRPEPQAAADIAKECKPPAVSAAGDK
jgi:hypothetical protein